MKSARAFCFSPSTPKVDSMARARTSILCLVYGERVYFRQILLEITWYFFTESSWNNPEETRFIRFNYWILCM
ncbi:MAG: hypothetical protein LUQ49_04590 [Methanomicrobiales archaeon]|nr:hypothetical protein [Methanomicrobiales archaeon]